MGQLNQKYKDAEIKIEEARNNKLDILLNKRDNMSYPIRRLLEERNEIIDGYFKCKSKKALLDRFLELNSRITEFFGL